MSKRKAFLKDVLLEAGRFGISQADLKKRTSPACPRVVLESQLNWWAGKGAVQRFKQTGRRFVWRALQPLTKREMSTDVERFETEIMRETVDSYVVSFEYALKPIELPKTDVAVTYRVMPDEPDIVWVPGWIIQMFKIPLY